MANDKSRTGPARPGDGTSQDRKPYKSIENKNDIIAIRDAINKHLSELDSPMPAKASLDLSATTDNTKNAVSGYPSQVKHQEASAALRTTNATDSNGCGCLLALATLSFFVALAFPPFWIIFIVLILVSLGNSR